MQKMILLGLFCLFCVLPAYSQSYTISQTQLQLLSTNLSTLKSLTLQLRQNLDSYKQSLQVTINDLQASQIELIAARNECTEYQKSLQNQQQMLIEQSKSLKTANQSLKALKRKDKQRNALFIGGLLIALMAK